MKPGKGAKRIYTNEQRKERTKINRAKLDRRRNGNLKPFLAGSKLVLDRIKY